MEFIILDQGKIIRFSSLSRLKQFVKNLQGFVELIEAEDVEPPYCYGEFDPNVGQEQERKIMEQVKDIH